MNFDNLLIFYAPGSRGDFLASVLLTQLMDQPLWHIKTEKIFNPYAEYIKAHDLTKDPGQFGKVQVEDLIINRSIRIKLQTPSDFLSAVYYSKAKILANKNLPEDSLLSNYLIKEKRYRKLDSMFDYVVDFSNLFDIEFIKQFYANYVGEELPAEAIKRIQDNINLHTVLNLENYQNYLNNVNINNFLKDYGSKYGNGFN
jgi:hypothetical protein